MHDNVAPHTIPVLQTTADEVVALFGTSPRSTRFLNDWRHRPKHGEVVAHVMAHTTTAPYRITFDQVHNICETTDHALGDVKKADIGHIREVIDWRPQYAFSHVFHYALEELGEPFTYEQFRTFCRSDPRARTMLWQPASTMVATLSRGRHSQIEAANAMRWRIGNAYYSHLRELYVVTYLRTRGLDLRVHPLADALFRVDAWLGRTVLDIYIINGAFRDKSRGRKIPAVDLLAETAPPFRFESIILDTPQKFGHVQLPATGHLDEVADRLNDSTSTSASS